MVATVANMLQPCSPWLRPRCCCTDIHQLLKHADASDGGISILGVHESWALTTSQPTHEAQEEQNVDAEECITCHAVLQRWCFLQKVYQMFIIADADGMADSLGRTVPRGNGSVMSLFLLNVCQLSAGEEWKPCIFFDHECHYCHAIVTAVSQPATTTATSPTTPKELMAPVPQTFLCNVRMQLLDIGWAVLSLQHLGQIEELVGQQRFFK